MDRKKLHSRNEVRQRLDLSDDVMSFWLKKGLLLPSQGGAGRGNHRRFPYWEINIGAILREVRVYGANIEALRQLSDYLRAPFLRFPALAGSELLADLNTDVIGQRAAFYRQGYVARAERNASTGKYEERQITWEDYAAHLRRELSSDGLDEALRIAETEDVNECAPYISMLSALSGFGDDDDSPYFFTRSPDGSWTMSYALGGEVSSIAIAIHRAFLSAWSTDVAEDK